MFLAEKVFSAESELLLNMLRESNLLGSEYKICNYSVAIPKIKVSDWLVNADWIAE